MSQRLERRLDLLQTVMFLILLFAVVLFPAYWMGITAFKPNREMYQAATTLVVQHPTLENFANLFAQTKFLIQFRNSVVVATSTTVISVAISALGAYSLTRVRYRGRDLAAAAVFFTYLLPPTLLFIPMYLLFSQTGLLNTPAVLVLSYLTITVPFCTWMLKGYFHSIPRELEEAAFVDGCTRLQALRRIVIPLAAPGIASSALFAFTLAWNEYLYAFIFVSQDTMTTLPVGLSSLIMGDVFLWGQIMAGALVMSLPILTIYFFGQRYIIGGMTAGAVKG